LQLNFFKDIWLGTRFTGDNHFRRSAIASPSCTADSAGPAGNIAKWAADRSFSAESWDKGLSETSGPRRCSFRPTRQRGNNVAPCGVVFPNPTAGEFFREDLGGHLEISTTYDYIQISASARADEFLTLVEAIGNAIANPSIDKQSVASLKQAQIEQIAAAERDPAFRGERAVLARLFGKFPYGRPIKGTRQSLANIDFADVIDAKKRFLVADNASVAISGPVDPSLAVRAVKRYFGAWSKADKSVPATFRQPDSPPSEVLVVEEDALPDFWVAFDGVPRGNAGFPAAEILGEILKFRLKANLTRDETSADVKNRSYLLRGAFAIGLPAGELEDAREFVRALIAKPIEQGEFESAKAKAVTAYLNLGADDIWLDSETYKSISLANAAAAISSVEIADLRSLQTRLAAEPFVAVRFSKKLRPQR